MKSLKYSQPKLFCTSYNTSRKQLCRVIVGGVITYFSAFSFSFQYGEKIPAWQLPCYMENETQNNQNLILKKAFPPIFQICIRKNINEKLKPKWKILNGHFVRSMLTSHRKSNNRNQVPWDNRSVRVFHIYKCHEFGLTTELAHIEYQQFHSTQKFIFVHIYASMPYCNRTQLTNYVYSELKLKILSPNPSSMHTSHHLDL